MKAVSTFSGCGGSSLGLRQAGIDVLWANEFVAEAAKTYAANAPSHTILSTKDIRQITGNEILEAINLDVGELDIFEGSPPCSSFSTSGKREASWGVVKKYSDTRQRVDDLFDEWLRVASEIRPKAMLAENVVGLKTGKASGVLRSIGQQIAGMGYVVSAKVINSSSFEVPQRRPRLFIQAIRSDLQKSPKWPEPKGRPVSIRQALPWVIPFADYSLFDDAPTESERKEASFEGYAIHDVWKRLRIGESPKGSYFNLIRSNPMHPSPTISQTAGNLSAAGVAHPYEPRRWTIGELKVLCGFPSDFVLTGTYKQQWERLGRAVTPPVYRAIGACLRGVLNER